MFVDLDWPLNASSLLSASAELLVELIIVGSLVLSTVGHVVIRVSGELLQSVSAAHAARGSRSVAVYKAELKCELKNSSEKQETVTVQPGSK